MHCRCWTSVMKSCLLSLSAIYWNASPGLNTWTMCCCSRTICFAHLHLLQIEDHCLYDYGRVKADLICLISIILICQMKEELDLLAMKNVRKEKVDLLYFQHGFLLTWAFFIVVSYFSRTAGLFKYSFKLLYCMSTFLTSILIWIDIWIVKQKY